MKNIGYYKLGLGFCTTIIVIVFFTFVRDTAFAQRRQAVRPVDKAPKKSIAAKLSVLGDVNFSTSNQDQTNDQSSQNSDTQNVAQSQVQNQSQNEQNTPVFEQSQIPSPNTVSPPDPPAPEPAPSSPSANSAPVVLSASTTAPTSGLSITPELPMQEPSSAESSPVPPGAAVVPDTPTPPSQSTTKVAFNFTLPKVQLSKTAASIRSIQKFTGALPILSAWEPLAANQSYTYTPLSRALTLKLYTIAALLLLCGAFALLSKKRKAVFHSGAFRYPKQQISSV